MTVKELRENLIEKYAMIFEEESGFCAENALDAATDMIDNGLSYEEAYGKYIVDLT